MSSRLEQLSQNLQNRLGERLHAFKIDRREITIEVSASDYFSVMQLLRDDPDLAFEQLIDLCGVDYSTYAAQDVQIQARFAVVVHLLSVTRNWRLRVRVFVPDDAFPVIDSVIPLWNSANWFEREAFDFFGIIFAGHPDLRRLLTDYGFIGHPFRKDFPISGTVEMRYDPDQKRVVYQPVTIEPRENTPRVVREAGYGAN